jgi:Sel1 repeat
MLLRLLPLLYLLLLPLTLLAQHSAVAKQEVVPDSCPATKPYQTSLFIPPAPYPTKTDSGTFWFGSDRLWTMLPVDALWSVPPLDATRRHPSINQKLGWWRQGYNAHAEPWPKLIVTGKRLDSSEPPLVVDRATDASFGQGSVMLVGLGFPTSGCWQITGHYEEAELTFVVWVAESTSQGPRWTEADRKAYLSRAQHGESGAQFWLGTAYEQGWFGKADFGEALMWLRKAATGGDPDAQNALGQMYEDGEGVQQDYVLAAKWYRKAAEHVPDLGGAGQGRNNLGLLYLDGLGVPKDDEQAYMWFSLTNNETSLSQAKAQMTPDQVLEAKRMAAEWKTHHSKR